MKESIYIFGASGYAKETALLIQEIGEYNIKAFVDKHSEEGNFIYVNTHIYPIISETDFYELCQNKRLNVVISIANTNIVNNLLKRFQDFCNFPNIIHPSSLFKGKYSIGMGNIIAYDCIFTEQVSIGSFNRFNIRITVGHDTVIGNNNHFNPLVSIAGNVNIGSDNLFGVNSVVLQNIAISDGNTIGAKSLVVKNILKQGTYFGIPAKKLEI